VLIVNGPAHRDSNLRLAAALRRSTYTPLEITLDKYTLETAFAELSDGALSRAVETYQRALLSSITHNRAAVPLYGLLANTAHDVLVERQSVTELAVR
jgi:hypothetical protein